MIRLSDGMCVLVYVYLFEECLGWVGGDEGVMFVSGCFYGRASLRTAVPVLIIGVLLLSVKNNALTPRPAGAMDGTSLSNISILEGGSLCPPG